MATLAEQLAALAAEHDLTALSVEIHRYASSGDTFFGAAAHAKGRICELADDRATPEAAINSAIAKVNARRGRIDVGVPKLEAA